MTTDARLAVGGQDFERRMSEIRARVDAATAGPWRWAGHDDGSIFLVSERSGRPVVLSAMRTRPCVVQTVNGEAVLTHDSCNECRDRMAAYLAGDSDPWDGVTACRRSENLNTLWVRSDGHLEPVNAYSTREQPYRSDIAHVDHPDAELLAHCRADVEWLLDQVGRLEVGRDALLAERDISDQVMFDAKLRRDRALGAIETIYKVAREARQGASYERGEP